MALCCTWTYRTVTHLGFRANKDDAFIRRIVLAQLPVLHLKLADALLLDRRWIAYASPPLDSASYWAAQRCTAASLGAIDRQASLRDNPGLVVLTTPVLTLASNFRHCLTI
jgi:hypothetical protein